MEENLILTLLKTEQRTEKLVRELKEVREMLEEVLQLLRKPNKRGPK